MILLPGAPLLRIILVSQIMNGVLLPFVLVFMLLLVNRGGIMGEHTNGRVYNLVSWPRSEWSPSSRSLWS